MNTDLRRVDSDSFPKSVQFLTFDCLLTMIVDERANETSDWHRLTAFYDGGSASFHPAPMRKDLFLGYEIMGFPAMTQCSEAV